MKTHILRLEPHDDVISTRDKMGWGHSGGLPGTSRILLVWPERGRILTRRLDMVLVQRHSVALGAQLAIVTRDPEVREHALELGIPVFSKKRHAQGIHWRVPRRYRQTPNRLQIERLKTGMATRVRKLPNRFGEAAPASHPWRQTRTLSPAVRLAFFTLGVLALLSIAAFLTPAAALVLAPQTRLQELDLTVLTGPEVREIELSGAVPLREISVMVEGRDTEAATGQQMTPNRPASGRVLFTNLTPDPVDIPEGLVVRTVGEAPVRFATTRSGRLPGGPGETLELPVEALAAGRAGNLSAGSLSAIEGPLGTQLAVTNRSATQGGSERRDRAVQAADRERLSERLRASLTQTARAELEASLGVGDILLPGSITMTRVVEEVYDPAQDEPADLVSLSMRMEYSAQLVSGQDLRRLAASVLDAGLPAGFVPASEEALEVDVMAVPQPAADGSASFQVHVSRPLQARLSEAQAVQLALGLPPAQAAQRLSAALPLAAAPEIRMTPAWWPRLPFVPFRIQVQQAASGS